MNNGRLFFDSSLHGNMLVLGNGDPFFHGSRSFLNMGETSKRLPFFYSSNDLLEEEFYDEQSPEKKRRLTSEQVHMLEKNFDEENKLEPERKTELAKKLGLQPRQVAVWFQNRRARSKTKQLEREYDLLKASYDSLLSNYDTIVKENEKLKSQVVSLEEKLQAKEEAGMTTMVVGQKSDPPLLADDYAEFAAIQVSVKAEDRLSTVSGRSIIVDDDGLQLVDSGNSYFSSEEYGPCMVGPIEEYGAYGQQHQEEETELMGWLVWS